MSLFVFFSLALPSFACCAAWPAGEKPVQIAAQEVLVVWDAENRIEHFVRRAAFDSEAIPKDFGFLVPTPTQPQLSEVPDLVFDQLGEVVKPKIKVEKVTRFSFEPLLFSTLKEGASKSAIQVAKEAKEGVEVLDTAMVGGFEASVLRAAETESLLKWLEGNGYDARPELRDWLRPYVEKQWIVTAFKYTGSLTRASVCLSFETDAPFFPYRVPSDIRVKPEDGSLLRLYFAGTERVTGEFEGGQDRSWNAATKFSGRDESVGDTLEQVGELSSDGRSFWLTAFEDVTWPGGAEDLYFKPSPEKDELIPPPILRSEIKIIHFPIDLILLFLGLLLYLYRKYSKHRIATK